MKKLLLGAGLFLVTALTAFAQVPQALNHQGIARNTSRTPLASSSIGLRLTVHDATEGGTIVYRETQTATTNSFGLYNLSIGAGTAVSGTFAGINWASGDKYLEVEIDPAGGSSYTSAGTSKLLSVPYSLYAKTNANSISGGTTNVVPKFTGASTL